MLAAIQDFLHYLEHEQSCAKNTIMAYKNDLMQFQRYIGEVNGHAVRPHNFSEEQAKIYLARISEAGYRPSTIYRKLAAVRSFLDFLRARGFLLTASMSERLQLSAAGRKIPLVLSKGDINKLLLAPAGQDSPLAFRDRAILELIYRTGSRVSEIVNLKLEDVNLEQAVIYTGAHTSALGEALGPIKEYMDHVRPHLVRDQEERALFLNQRGKGLTRQGLWLIVKRRSEEAEIGGDVSPHTLRHSLVSHLLDEGRTVKQVQMKLGMKSPNAIRIFSPRHRKAGSK